MLSPSHFMEQAIALAQKSAAQGEVPVGCVIVKGGVIISRGQNKRENNGTAIWHAEIFAIKKACEKLNSWRLDECEMYITLEPCPMCAGAIINARIPKLYFGAFDINGGACSNLSRVNLFEAGYNHRPMVIEGFMREDCENLLKNFFKNLR